MRGDEPITLNDVSLDESSPIVRLWRAQVKMFGTHTENVDIDSPWSSMRRSHD